MRCSQSAAVQGKGAMKREVRKRTSEDGTKCTFAFTSHHQPLSQNMKKIIKIINKMDQFGRLGHRSAPKLAILF